MINQEVINDKISKFIDINNVKVHDEKYDLNNVQFEKIRDSIYKLGDVLEEDIDNKVFIVNIRSGLLNSIQILTCIYCDEKIIYYKIFDQTKKIDNTSINNIINKINKEMGIKCNKKKLKIHNIIITIVIFFIIFCGVYFYLFYKITEKYNMKINEYNQKLVQYKKEIKVVDVSNIDSFQNILDTLKNVDLNFINLCFSIKDGNRIEKVNRDIVALDSEILKLNNNIDTIKKICNPNVDEIFNKISSVTYVDKAEIVNEEQKESEIFKYDGIFKDCIYFTIKELEQGVDGNSPVEKGTDAGGCIEIYENLEKARKRYDYLMGFDNTIYYSGQFICVGTMIVRTSYKLSDELNNSIVNAIINSIIS